MVVEYSNGVSYVQEGADYNFIIKDSFKGFYLESNVSEVEENERFIFFKQSLDKEGLRRNIGRDLYPNERYLDSINYRGQADSIIQSNPYLKKQTKFNTAYWILLKSTDSLLGPFEKRTEVEKYGF